MTLAVVHPSPEEGTCRESPSLREIRPGNCDELGNTILKVCWLGADYAIYRTAEGVFVHFADCPIRAKEQRRAFMEIAPELCELRFLTADMRRPGLVRRIVRRVVHARPDDASFEDLIYDHNITQALMLLMEGNKDDAETVARAALDMAVLRTTNDNTIRYVKSAMKAAALLALGFGAVLVGLDYWQPSGQFNLYVIAALYGILGSAFSVMARVSSFDMRPCQQSSMNYWMARLRIALGLVGGFAVYLIVKHPVAAGVVGERLLEDWQGAALIGFLGGFAERLAPTVFSRAAQTMQGSSGTPVQEARRRAEMQGSAVAG